MAKMNTAEIREHFKQKRRLQTDSQRSAAATAAIALWQRQRTLTEAQRIGLHWAIRGELPTQGLIRGALSAGQEVFLPKPDETKAGTLLFGQYHTDTTMTSDRFGIPVPIFSATEAASIASLNVILLPLVAADNQGNRIGMGAGFYDRTLASLPNTGNTLLIGWCYEWQVLDEPLKPEPWDIPLHGIITDKQTRWFSDQIKSSKELS
jgi:5-formyltetrahydrofolate cyclo-ligase